MYLFSSDAGRFPTVLPTNTLNPRKTPRYEIQRANTRKSSNPLHQKGLEDFPWYEWAHRKSIHGFLVRMRSAVRIRPAAPKSIENFGFRCFFAVKIHFEVWVKLRGNRFLRDRYLSDGSFRLICGVKVSLDMALAVGAFLGHGISSLLGSKHKYHNFARRATVFEMIFLLFPAAQNMCRFALPLGVCRVNRTSL